MLSADSTDKRNTKKVILVSRFCQSNYANLDQDKILKIIPRKFLGLAEFIGICSKECSNKKSTPTLSVLFFFQIELDLNCWFSMLNLYQGLVPF